MSNTSGLGDVGVSFFASPDSEARLVNAIEGAVGKGFTEGVKHLTDALSSPAYIRNLKKIQGQMRQTFDGGQFKKLISGLDDIDQAFLRFVKTSQAAGATQRQIVRQMEANINRLRRTSVENTEEAISNRVKEIAAGKRQIVAEQQNTVRLKGEIAGRLQAERAAFDTAGRLERERIQNSLVANRVAGQQRVAITRAVIDQIQRLERGAASLIKSIGGGIAGGISGVAGAGARGVGSLFRRQASEVSSTNTILERELRQRESIVRSSFSRQERELRTSVLRQQKILTSFRTRTSTGVAGAVTGRGIGGGLAGLGAGVGIGLLLREGFKDSVNLTEQLNKNKVVFGAFAQQIEDFSKSSVSALGVTQSKALEATGTFGNLFRAIGLTEQQSTFMSVALTNLATDLASFNNSSPEEAFEAIRSGLVGEQEPLRRFGVNLNEATLKAKALELGLFNGKGTLDANAKAQAAFALILEQTTLAQGDFARTAEEGANAQRRAKAAALQFASVLAGQLKGAITGLANLAVPVFKTLADLVSGQNLSAGLRLLRDGLKGAALGLAAVIAVKGGVEVLQLLGNVVKLALTPFGLLVTLAVGLGAAISILSDRSQAFRDFLGAAKDKAIEFGNAAKDFLVPKLEALRDFITDSAIPAVIRFAQMVGRGLVTAFHASVDFITGTVIPKIRQFISFVAENVAPVIERAGEIIGNAFEFARDKAVAFAQFVRPFIQPAIDGFKKLGSAIADALGGDFASLGRGALGALGGIGSSFKNIGLAIFEAIKPLGPKLVEFLGSVFSGPNLSRLAGGLLDFVEFIGHFIGSHADVIVEGFAAVVAAAGVVAFRFAKGFVEGLTESIPRLLRDLGGLIVDNLQTVVIAAFFGVGLLRPLIARFRSIGQESGQSFGQGFKAAFSNSAGFISGLLGGVGRSDKKTLKSTLSNLALTSRGNANIAQALGGSTKGLGVDEAIVEVRRLQGAMSAAQVSGLVMRNTIRQAFVGSGGLVETVKQTFTNLRANAVAQGTTIGRQFAAGLKKGLTTAAAGVGGFLAGRAEGQAGGGGLLSILGSGLTAGLITGSPIIGAVAGLGAAIGNAFGSADRETQQFNDNVKALATAIKSDLSQALKDGTVDLIDFRDALSGGAEGEVGKNILDSFSSGVKGTLAAAGLDSETLLRLLKSGGLDQVIALIDKIDRSKGAPRGGGTVVELRSAREAEAIAALTSQYNLLTAAIDAANTARGFDNGPQAFERHGLGTTRAPRSESPFGGLNLQIRDVLPEKIPTPSIDLSGLRNAITNVNADLDRANARLGTYLALIKEAFGGADNIDFETATNQAVVNTEQIVTNLSSIDVTGLAGKAKAALEKEDLGNVVGELVAAGIKDGTIKSVEDAAVAIGPLLQSAIETVNSLDIPEAAKQDLRDQIAAMFTEGLAAAGLKIPGAVEAVADSITAEFNTQFAGFPVELQLLGIAGIDGLTKGLGDSTAIARMAAAAQGLADIVVDRIGGARGLFVGSPSKVTIQIGRWVGEGLAIGLQESTADLGSVISSAIDDAIGKAMNAADRGREALQGAFSGIFGSVTAGGGAGVAGITSEFQGFLASFDATVSKVFDLADKIKKGKEPLSAAERDLIGESAFSLNPADVLGVGNIGALTSALDAIKEFGQALIAQGSTPQFVAESVQLYVKQLTDQAKALGFSSEEIDQLVTNLGLSNDALALFVAAAESAAAGVNQAVETIFDVVKKAAAAAAIGSALSPDEYIKDLVSGLPEGVKAMIKNMSHGDLVKALASGALGDLGGLDPEIVARFIEASYGGGFGSPIYPPTPEAGDPSQPVGGGGPEIGSLPRRGGDIYNIYPPTGNPYAIALEVANRQASNANVPGG